MIPRQRSRAVILSEIEEACRRRCHANETDDFEAYQHLCEHVDDLRIELYALSSVRRRPT